MPSPNPYESTTENPSGASKKFWIVFGAILFIGLWSLVVRRANPIYGQFGGYADNVWIWLGGFAVLPGIIDALIFDPVEGTGDRAIGIVLFAFYLVSLLVLVWKRKNWFMVLGVSYAVSLAVNLFNFLYVALSGL